MNREKIAKLLRLARRVEEDCAGNLEAESITSEICMWIEELAELAGVRGADADSIETD